MKMKHIILVVVILAIAGIAAFLYYDNQKTVTPPNGLITTKGDIPAEDIPTEINDTDGDINIPNRAPMAPSVSCFIDAEVLSAKKTNTNYGEFALNAGRENSDYYLIKLDISDISTSNSSGVGSCDENYIKSAEDDGIIFSLTDFEKNPLSKGQKINATISADGDEYFSGYFFRGPITIQ